MSTLSQIAPPGAHLSAGQARELIAQACPAKDYKDKKVLLIVPDATRTAPVGLLFKTIHAQIGSATYYTTPLHLQPALRYLGYEPGSLPETERVAEVNFSVPLWPGMPIEAQERVVDVVRSAVAAAAPAA